MKSKRQRKPARQSRTRSEQRAIRRNFIRKTLSLLLLLLCAVPMLGGRVQPLWVIPAVMCIAMREDLYFTMGASVLAGFCIDLACGSVLGVNSIFLVCWTTFVVLLFEQILRRSFLHYIWLTAAGTFLHALLRYFLKAVIYQTVGRELLWKTVLLPSALLTVAAALIVYVLYLPLMRLRPKRARLNG